MASKTAARSYSAQAAAQASDVAQAAEAAASPANKKRRLVKPPRHDINDQDIDIIAPESPAKAKDAKEAKEAKAKPLKSALKKKLVAAAAAPAANEKEEAAAPAQDKDAAAEATDDDAASSSHPSGSGAGGKKRGVPKGSRRIILADGTKATLLPNDVMPEGAVFVKKEKVAKAPRQERREGAAGGAPAASHRSKIIMDHTVAMISAFVNNDAFSATDETTRAHFLAFIVAAYEGSSTPGPKVSTEITHKILAAAKNYATPENINNFYELIKVLTTM